MSNEPQTRARRLSPPAAVWIFVVVLLGVNIWTHLPDFFDHAVANIILMASTFLALAVLLVWLAVFSGHRPAIRWTPLLVAIAIGGAWLATHRIDHVHGRTMAERLENSLVDASRRNARQSRRSRRRRRPSPSINPRTTIFHNSSARRGPPASTGFRWRAIGRSSRRGNFGSNRSARGIRALSSLMVSP